MTKHQEAYREWIEIRREWEETCDISDVLAVTPHKFVVIQLSCGGPSQWIEFDLSLNRARYYTSVHGYGERGSEVQAIQLDAADSDFVRAVFALDELVECRCSDYSQLVLLALRGPFARGPAARAWLRDALSAAMDLADGRPVTVGLIREGISEMGTVQKHATERGDSDQLASCDERFNLLGFANRSAGVLP